MTRRPSTSSNSSTRRALCDRIAASISISPADFPTDRYVVEGIAAARGLQVSDNFDDLDDVAVMVRSVVDYRTAEVADVVAETARATPRVRWLLWDLSHAAGVLAIDLDAAGVQLAVGCTYKYLNGGPGSPAFSYVARDLQASCRSRSGAGSHSPTSSTWDRSSHLSPTFAGSCSARHRSSRSLRRRKGSPSRSRPVSSGLPRRPAALTGFGMELCDQFGLASTSPPDPACRGGHVAVVHPDARASGDRARRARCDHGLSRSRHRPHRDRPRPNSRVAVSIARGRTNRPGLPTSSIQPQRLSTPTSSPSLSKLGVTDRSRADPARQQRHRTNHRRPPRRANLCDGEQRDSSRPSKTSMKRVPSTASQPMRTMSGSR